MKGPLFERNKPQDLESDGEIESHQKKSEMTFSDMYRFADRHDKIFLVLGVLCAICNGAALPATVLIMVETVEDVQAAAMMDIFLDAIPGYLTDNSLSRKDVLRDPSLLRAPCGDEFFDNTTQDLCDLVDLSSDTLSDKIQIHVIVMAIIGVLVLVIVTIQTVSLGISAQKQVNRIRRECLANILQQEIGWFDTIDTVELTSRLSSDITRIQNGIGDKVGLTTQAISTFIVGYIVAFAKVWKLALLFLSVTPLLIAIGGTFTYVGVFFTTKEQKASKNAKVLTEEVFSSIRTVVAFGGEDKESKRYQKLLGEIEQLGVKKYFWLGFIFGSLALVHYCSYALGLWYGGRLARHDDFKSKDVATAHFCITLGTMSMAAMVMGFASIQDGREAACQVFQVIDRKSRIPSGSTKGVEIDRVKGDISFRDVHFSHSLQLNEKVLSGVNIEIPSGQTVALAGLRGHGRSVLMKLLMRFYDPHHGEILLDGHNLRDINVKWLRQSIGFVSQEPVLFDTTIAENISFGRDGVTEEEIFQATKDANAYEFIATLPDRLYTRVGKRGVQLNRGQMLRIAIARALVRNPKILLLDNVTSGLDGEDASVVQNSLDKAKQGRTTLIIADHPSTIRAADLIVVLEDGTVSEQGTFDQLMARHGFFYNFFLNQTQAFGEMEEFAEHSADQGGEILQTKSPSYSEPNVSKMLLHTAKTDEPGEELLPQVSTRQILQLNSPEYKYLFLGFSMAAIMGSAQIAFAYVFSKLLDVLAEKGQEQKDDIRKYSLYLIGLGLLSLVATTIQSWTLGVAGEALTKRLRQSSFVAILRQEIAWFDKPYNSVAALAYRLEKDALLVKEGTTTRLGILVQSVSALIVLLVVMTTFNFLLAVITSVTYMLIMVTGLIYLRLMKNVEVLKEGTLQGADKIAGEAVGKIKTVAPMTEEHTFYTMYSQKLNNLMEKEYANIVPVGFVFGFIQSMTFLASSIVFWTEGHLVDNDDFDAKDIYHVFALALFGSLFMVQAIVVAADDEKAKSATRRVFHLLQRQTKMDADSSNGMTPPTKFFKGPLAVTNARFCYPFRTDIPDLQNMNFTIEPKQTVAFVGSNNSAIFSHLERFYNFEKGNMRINNYDINDVNIKWLRAQIGLVSQKPLLFDCSIADNIAYGDNSRVVSMDEIISAARQANIHNFIQGLPMGYHTYVGGRGTQLSDEQKQKLAIARALIRDPKILLLEEPACVAEDGKEQIVREAVRQVQDGRTCLIIAERLSNPWIQNADKILVLHCGRIVEQGTHNQLVAKKGFYARLLKMQNLS